MLTVTDDKAVSVSGLRLGYATFYPVKDGYRDTLAVRGTLGERARVVIRVRNAAHTLVRTKDLGVRAAGPYSWSWNGRNDGGVLLPAGTYTVSQRVTDTAGNGLTWKYTVNLSRKSLHWTSRTITKTGDQFGLSWDQGAGWISTEKSPYADGVRLRSSGDLAGVRYTFRLHSGVAYSALTFRVLGRSPNGLVGLAGLWNAVNAADNPKAFVIREIGPSYRWWSMAFSSARRSGTLTYGMVMAPASPSTTFDIARVQLVYRYAILQ
jgi:hypothetical protein